MATNLALDDKLIQQATKLGKHKSKREAVNAALEQYVRLAKVKAFFDLAGTIEFREDFDDGLGKDFIAKKPSRRRRSA
jgi:Arc/MetJ family transcription regulator